MNYLIQKIISAPFINEPWPHKVIDDFFDHDTFINLQKTCANLLPKYGTHPGDKIRPHSIDLLNEDPIVHDTILDAVFCFERGARELVNHFPKSRKYNHYKCMPLLHFMHPFAGYKGIHDEKHTKSVSIVVYIHPIDSLGTKMYTRDRQFHSHVDWKPNRAMIFSGQSGITWHDFGSEDLPRSTLNFFIERKDPTEF